MVYNRLQLNTSYDHRLGETIHRTAERMDTSYNNDGYNNKCCNINPTTVLDWFFITRPRLHIECEENKEPDIFTPLSEGTKYLRIWVKNKGRRTAENCRARLIVMEDGGDPLRYPTTDPKPLPWGRLLDLSDLKCETSIHPFIGEELLHVAFSAEWFGNEQPDVKYHRHAQISILDRIRGNQFRKEDGFTLGDFIVEVIITSEGAFTKAKLLIHVEKDFRRIGIKKLSRFEVLKYKLHRFKRYIARVKRSR
jgi:hypothetical protein